MRKLGLLVIVLVSMALTAGCLIESSSSVEGNVSIPNSLGFGSTDDGVIVAFVRVEDDSRCPANVECVRAGEAFVVLEVTVDDEEPQEFRVEMVPGGEATIEVDRFTITVLALTPDPPPAGGVEQDEYEVQLRMEG